MHDADVFNLKLRARRFAEFAHFRQSHRIVSLVNQIQSFASARPAPHVTVERHGRAALRRDKAARHRSDIKRFGR